MEFERHVTGPTEELLSGFRAVVINGPRQAGKSTLVRQVQRDRGPVITLDDPGAREAEILVYDVDLVSLPSQLDGPLREPDYQGVNGTRGAHLACGDSILVRAQRWSRRRRCFRPTNGFIRAARSAGSIAGRMTATE